MTPQEQQLIADLFDRLASLEGQPRDPDADRLIRQGLSRAPSAMYALVQTVLVQDEYLRRANARIEELEQAAAAPPAQTGGGFLDSMRNMVGGGARGSVPSVRPSGQGSSGVWGSAPSRPATPPPPAGYPQQQTGYPQGGYPPAGGYPAQPGYPPGAPMGAPPARGGSFLGTAAAAAAGMVGGGLLLGGIRNMMGGEHGSLGGGLDHAGTGASGAGTQGSSPWDRGSDPMSRDAGLNDIGGGGHSTAAAAAPDIIGDSGFYNPSADGNQSLDQGGSDYDTGGFDDSGFGGGDSDNE